MEWMESRYKKEEEVWVKVLTCKVSQRYKTCKVWERKLGEKNEMTDNCE